MAKFSVKCPACGESITCDDEWRGMNLECPYCKQNFTAPRKKTPRQQFSGKTSFQDDGNTRGLPEWHYRSKVAFQDDDTSTRIL